MKSFLNLKVRLAFGFAMLMMLLMGSLSYRWMIVSAESDGMVRHSHTVIETIQDLALAMGRIESASREFVLTGEESDLDSYRESIANVARDEAAIRSMTVDNPVQQARFPDLEVLAAERIQYADMIVNLRRNEGLAAAADAIGTGPDERDTEFRALVGGLQDEELRLLAKRNAETSRDLSQTKPILLIGTLMGILIAGIAAWSAVRDSTKRAVAEDKLQQSESKYRMLLDGVPDYAIFMLDPQGKVVSWSAGAEHIKGFTAEEIINRSFSCFFVPEDIKRGRPEEVLRMAAASGRHEELGMRVRKDGSEFLCSATYIALRDPSGNLRGFSEICRDLTEHKESEAKYRGLLEAAPDGMVVVNEDGEIVLLNAQAEKQFGYRRDELLGQKVTNIIPEGFAERLIADGTRTAAEALAQQIGMGIELSGRRKDGSEFPIEIMLSPLESSEGVLVTAAVRDITLRKDAEKHLAQMEARYRGLLEAAPDGMVVVNQAGEIVLLNAQAEEQFGYRRDELLGQNVTNIIPKGFAERLIAYGTRTAAEALAQQVGTGIELHGLRKDGTEFPIEITLSPLDSLDGILVTAAIRNIALRKDAEKRLAQMEAKYRGLLEAAPDGMVVVNEDGVIVLLNAQAEKQFGYHRDELLGRNVKDIIPEGFAERLIADARRTTAEAPAQQIGTGIELLGRRKDGAQFPIEILLSPLESAEGVLVTAAIRDISERKELARQLRQSLKMEAIGQLTGGIAHDFNNLLAIVIGNLGLMERMIDGNEPAMMRLKPAQKAAARGAALARRLLALASKEDLNPASIRIEDVIQETIEFAARALGPEIRIVTHFDDSVPPVFVDATGLGSALLNLTVNARDAMPKGGTLTISTQMSNLDESFPPARTGELKPGTYARISVSDTGHGMSKEVLERALEPFFTTKPRSKGTGLGLAMVYGFARQSGGTVRLYSEQGCGTTVSLYLPPAGECAPAVCEVPEAQSSAQPGGTVLVVDDEAELLEIARIYLTEMGYSALCADNAATALNTLAQYKEIDLMITDIIMPGGMNGVELAEKARRLRPDLKVIYSSGFPADALAERADTKVDGPMLRKPYHRTEFVRIVQHTLEGAAA